MLDGVRKGFDECHRGDERVGGTSCFDTGNESALAERFDRRTPTVRDEENLDAASSGCLGDAQRPTVIAPKIEYEPAVIRARVRKLSSNAQRSFGKGPDIGPERAQFRDRVIGGHTRVVTTERDHRAGGGEQVNGPFEGRPVSVAQREMDALGEVLTVTVKSVVRTLRHGARLAERRRVSTAEFIAQCFLELAKAVKSELRHKSNDAR